MGMYSCEQRTQQQNKQRVIDNNTPFITANDGKVKVLWVYPRHGHKGHFNGHYAVVEGVNNKERKEISVQPKLPVPEEIWLIGLNDRGCYIFKEKLK